MPCRVPKRRFSCGAPQHLTKNLFLCLTRMETRQEEVLDGTYGTRYNGIIQSREAERQWQLPVFLPVS